MAAHRLTLCHAQSAGELLTPRELIEILMQEYGTLREEITNRIKSRFAITGYVGAIVAFAFSQLKDVPWPDVVWPLSLLGIRKGVAWPAVIIGIALIFLLTLWWWLGSLIKKCSVRVAEIEQTVNALAGREVLIWETRQHETGLFHKIYRD